MKAIFIYSRLTGNSLFLTQLDFIKSKLSKRFSTLKVVETKDYNELKDNVLLACKEYDYLIFVGGDGTVNSIINIIAKEPRKPVLGYIPGGTTNDFACNFHLSKNFFKAVNTIVNGKEVAFDIVRVNDKYFAYVLACGAFSEISYSAQRKYKKHLGNLAYYTIALKDVFKKETIVGELKCNGKTYDVYTPFVLVLNGNHVGGFYVNFKNKINDGKFHVFLTRPGLFNGLLHYLFFKVRTTKIITDKFTFNFKDKKEKWCLDGESADLGNVEVECLKQHIKIITTKHLAKKLNQNK